MHQYLKEDYLELNEKVKNAKQPKDGIYLVKKYEDLIKETNRRIVNVVGKQGELLKRFKDSDEFSSRVGLSRSNIYFKIGLYITKINSYLELFSEKF